MTLFDPFLAKIDRFSLSKLKRGVSEGGPKMTHFDPQTPFWTIFGPLLDPFLDPLLDPKSLDFLT